jgi:hypothetical protein
MVGSSMNDLVEDDEVTPEMRTDKIFKNLKKNLDDSISLDGKFKCNCQCSFNQLKSSFKFIQEFIQGAINDQSIVKLLQLNTVIASQ